MGVDEVRFELIQQALKLSNGIPGVYSGRKCLDPSSKRRWKVATIAAENTDIQTALLGHTNRLVPDIIRSTSTTVPIVGMQNLHSAELAQVILTR